jgi:hypothetical protein
MKLKRLVIVHNKLDLDCDVYGGENLIKITDIQDDLLQKIINNNFNKKIDKIEEEFIENKDINFRKISNEADDQNLFNKIIWGGSKKDIPQGVIIGPDSIKKINSFGTISKLL